MNGKQALERIETDMEYVTRLDFVEPIVRGEVQQELYKIYHRELPELDIIKNDLDLFETIINKDVDIWLVRNCDYENYIRIRKLSLIDSKVYCDDGAVVENQLTKDEFEKIQQRIDQWGM